MTKTANGEKQTGFLTTDGARLSRIFGLAAKPGNQRRHHEGHEGGRTSRLHRLRAPAQAVRGKDLALSQCRASSFRSTTNPRRFPDVFNQKERVERKGRG